MVQNNLIKSKLGEIITLTDGKVVGMGELAKEQFSGDKNDNGTRFIFTI